MRIPILLAAAALSVSAAPLAAQTRYLVSPNRLWGTEGEGFSDRFGAWPEARQQLLDGENRGIPTSLHSVAWRLDFRSHAPHTTAGGRSWSQVTVRVGDGDIDQATSVFSTNLINPPTTVFQGAVKWPDQFGTPLRKPTTWGGTAGEFILPFATPWKYAGTQDIVTDWTFTGGTLHSLAKWTGAVGYVFDGDRDPEAPDVGDYRSYPVDRLNNDSPGVTFRCNDSHFAAVNTGAYARIYAQVYGPDAASPALRNMVALRSTSDFTAPGSPVIHSWGFGTLPQGIDLGTGCNRLYQVGLTILLAHTVAPATANPTASVASPVILTPWASPLSNLTVSLQAGWSDSARQYLSLTQAHEVTLPLRPPAARMRRVTVTQAVGGPVQGPDFGFRWNPVLRYRL